MNPNLHAGWRVCTHKFARFLVFPSDRLTAEAIVGYKTRDSGGGGNGSGIRGPSEKSSVSPAVALAMSSGEDSSDSECDPMAIQGDEDRLKVDETDSLSLVVLPFADGAVLVSSTPAEPASLPNNALPDECGDIGLRKPMAQNRDKREVHDTFHFLFTLYNLVSFILSHCIIIYQFFIHH